MTVDFGFRAAVSAYHAIFSLEGWLAILLSDSHVYLGFLDCRKALARISHWGSLSS